MTDGGSNLHLATSAQMWSRAEEAFESGDLAGALFMFKKIYQEGYPEALVEIGNIYEQGGGGVEKDIDEAIKFYKKSIVACDDPLAHMAFGRLLLRIAKKQADFEIARAHFQKCVLQDEVGAIFGMGLIYDKGLGVEVDKEKAISFYNTASEKGHITAEAYKNRIVFERNRFKGLVPLVLSLFKVIGVSIKNPTDKRLGIR